MTNNEYSGGGFTPPPIVPKPTLSDLFWMALVVVGIGGLLGFVLSSLFD